MAKRADRIVIDTNLWISFLITNNFKNLDYRIKLGKIKILFSLELMEEFLTVANRPKFKKYFSKVEVEQLIDLFDIYGEMIQVKTNVNLCRDPKDNFLLSLSIDGNAQFLITGDKGLLAVKQIGKTKIITMFDYLAILQ